VAKWFLDACRQFRGRTYLRKGILCYLNSACLCFTDRIPLYMVSDLGTENMHVARLFVRLRLTYTKDVYPPSGYTSIHKFVQKSQLNQRAESTWSQGVRRDLGIISTKLEDAVKDGVYNPSDPLQR
jgi:hypothetical protein